MIYFVDEFREVIGALEMTQNFCHRSILGQHYLETAIAVALATAL